jgi:hypothetical protein
MPINTFNDSPAVMPIYISNPPPDNHVVSMRNFQEASIEITAETSRNSTRSLPKHHLNTTIDEFTSGKLEPIATSSPKIEITPDLQYIIILLIVTPPASQKLQHRLTI